MVGQENSADLLADTSIGIQDTSFIDKDAVDIIFGGPSATTDPNSITPVKEEKEKKKPEAAKTIETPEVATNEADLVLGNETAETEEEETEEVETSEATDSNTFELLSNELFDLGVFNKGENEEPITTPEQFRDRFVQEVKNQSNSQIYNFITSKYGQEGLDVFNSIFVHGVPPQEYLSKFVQLESVKELDITQEAAQKQVVTEFYKRQGLSQDKIDKKVQRLVDTGDLEEEAGDLYATLVQQEEDELQELVEQRESQEKAKLQYKQVYVQTVNNILADKVKAKEFDGIPVTDKVARETFNYLTDDSKWQMPSGERLTEFDKDLLDLRKPENYELKVKVALLLRGKMDLTKVKNSVVSKQSNEMFKNLATKEKVAKRTNDSPKSSTSFIDNLK